MSTEKKTLTILNEVIAPGESKEVNFDVANLHTSTPVNIPVIIERSKKKDQRFYSLLVFMEMK